MKEVLLTSSVLIAALLILRRLFRNSISRRVQYALWGLALLRLLVPVSLPPSGFSVLSAAQPARESVSARLDGQTFYVLPVDRAPAADYLQAEQTQPGGIIPAAASSGYAVLSDDGQTVTTYAGRLTAAQALTGIWLAGVAVMSCWLARCNLRFWRMLRRGRTPYAVEGCKRRVWLVEEGLLSPCLFGLFRPAIYLTPAAVSGGERLRYVLVHEETHARHLDLLWSLLRSVCLAVYWFDPLVWCAAVVSRTDCELACDEGALRRLGEGERIAYGRTLLSLVPVRKAPASPLLAATTMTAGKRQMKDRITRIAERRKTAVIALLAVAVVAALVCAVTFTGCGTTASNPQLQEEAGNSDRDLTASEAGSEPASNPSPAAPVNGSGGQEEQGSPSENSGKQAENTPAGNQTSSGEGPAASGETGEQTGSRPAESQPSDSGGSAARNECVITGWGGLPGSGESGNAAVIQDAAGLRAFLDGLEYHAYTCDGLPEYEISFGDGTAYQVNLSSQWVWLRGQEREAVLSEALLTELQALMGIEQAASFSPDSADS